MKLWYNFWKCFANYKNLQLIREKYTINEEMKIKQKNYPIDSNNEFERSRYFDGING